LPGFAVLVVEAGAGVGFAAEQEAGAADGSDRDDVPGVFGDDVGGQEVDFGGEVGEGASVGAAVAIDAVEAVEELGGAFDLDAPEGAEESRGQTGIPAAQALVCSECERGEGAWLRFRRRVGAWSISSRPRKLAMARPGRGRSWSACFRRFAIGLLCGL